MKRNYWIDASETPQKDGCYWCFFEKEDGISEKTIFTVSATLAMANGVQTKERK